MTRMRRIATAAASMTASAAVMCGALEGAEPATATPLPGVALPGVTIAAMGSSAPEIIDPYGRPSSRVLDAVEQFARTAPGLSDDTRNTIRTAVQFYRTNDNPDVELPSPDAVAPVTQFYWPTIAGECINGETNALASAIAIPGPSPLPLPGVNDDETAFIVTALGTAPLAENPGDMRVKWFNITTGQHGDTPLGNTGINPDGPATVSGIARTGSGTVVALAHGTIATADAACTFAPTAAIIQRGA